MSHHTTQNTDIIRYILQICFINPITKSQANNHNAFSEKHVPITIHFNFGNTDGPWRYGEIIPNSVSDDDSAQRIVWCPSAVREYTRILVPRRWRRWRTMRPQRQCRIRARTESKPIHSFIPVHRCLEDWMHTNVPWSSMWKCGNVYYKYILYIYSVCLSYTGALTCGVSRLVNGGIFRCWTLCG